MYLDNGLLSNPSLEFDISDSNDSFEMMGDFFHFLFSCMSSTGPWMTNFLLGLPPPLFYVALSLPLSACGALLTTSDDIMFLVRVRLTAWDASTTISLLLVLLVAWGVFSLLGLDKLACAFCLDGVSRIASIASFSLVRVPLVARGAFCLISVLFFTCVPLSMIIVLFTSIDINLVVVLPLHTSKALPLLYVVCLACVSKDYIIRIMVIASFNTPTFNCTSYSCTNNLL